MKITKQYLQNIITEETLKVRQEFLNNSPCVDEIDINLVMEIIDAEIDKALNENSLTEASKPLKYAALGALMGGLTFGGAGYKAGKEAGYKSGEDIGYQTGYKVGDKIGFMAGVQSGQQDPAHIQQLVSQGEVKKLFEIVKSRLALLPDSLLQYIITANLSREQLGADNFDKSFETVMSYSKQQLIDKITEDIKADILKYDIASDELTYQDNFLETEHTFTLGDYKKTDFDARQFISDYEDVKRKENIQKAYDKLEQTEDDLPPPPLPDDIK